MPLARKRARVCGPSLRRAVALCPDETVLVDDDLSVRDLRRIRKCRLQLLVAHPGGRDASRLVGLGRSVEEVDRAHHAVAGLDEVVALEAWERVQAGQEALVELLGQLVGATLVDTFVASN